MPVRSRRLYGPEFLDFTAIVQPIWAPPAGRTAIIRSLWVCQPGGGTRTLTLYSGQGDATAPFHFVPFTAAGAVRIDSWWVLDQENELRYTLSGSSNVAVSLTLFGALLEGDPE